MSLPNQIDLFIGADNRLQTGLWLIWSTAFLNILFHLPAMNFMLQCVSAALLLMSVPNSHSPSMKHQRLSLDASGSLRCDGAPGRWHNNTWRSPWYTVIRIRTGDRQWWAWVSASKNPPDAYRRLGIWCRYSPQQSAEMDSAGTFP